MSAKTATPKTTKSKSNADDYAPRLRVRYGYGAAPTPWPGAERNRRCHASF